MGNSSRILLYGTGVFTTIAVYDGEPLFWEKHWRRLIHDSERLGIDTSPYSEYMVRRGLDESIPDGDKLKPQKARITITDEMPSPLWSAAAARSPIPSNITFLISPLRITPHSFRLGVSPHLANSTSPLAGVKTCNYLDQLMSLNEARSHGCDEAVRVNERGHVTSACMANIFWLKEGQLFTPSLSTGCLPGTTREFVFESLACDEVEAGIEELGSAEAIFLTSAGLGIAAVRDLDGRELASAHHPILDLMPKIG